MLLNALKWVNDLKMELKGALKIVRKEPWSYSFWHSYTRHFPLTLPCKWGRKFHFKNWSEIGMRGGRGGREKSDGLENEYLHRLGGRVIKRAGPSSLMGAWTMNIRERWDETWEWNWKQSLRIRLRPDREVQGTWVWSRSKWWDKIYLQLKPATTCYWVRRTFRDVKCKNWSDDIQI